MKLKQLIIISTLVLSHLNLYGHDRIKIVFRYDDYQMIPSTINDSVLNIFRRNNIPLCLGIIPYDTNNKVIYQIDNEKLNDLRLSIEKGEIEIALHGYNHLNHLVIPHFRRVSYSEFATINPEIQYEKIAKGKRTLDSLFEINTNIFIPPFNTYDRNTLKVLVDLNFEIISGSMAGPYSNNKIKYIPATYEDFSELHRIINNNSNTQFTLIIYFHPYSFTEFTSLYSKKISELIDVRKLEELLNWLKKQDVGFYTFTDLAMTEDYNQTLFQANSLKYNLLKKVLNKLKRYEYGIYLPLEYHQTHYWLLIWNIVFHLTNFIFIYFFVYFCIKIIQPDIKIVLVILGLLFCAILFFLYSIRTDFSFWIFFILILVNLSAIISSLLRFYLVSNKSKREVRTKRRTR